MRSKEDVIRDQRTIEATKKGLMSGSGKLGTIARVLGDRVAGKHSPSSSPSGSGPFESVYGFSQSFMDDDDDELPPGQLPTGVEGMRANASLFNGYSRGYHLEIKYDNPELWVSWKGEIVYHEMAGELVAYCPGEWEEVIEKLTVQARRKEGQFIEAYDERNEIIGQRKKEAFLDEMRRKWGLK